MRIKLLLSILGLSIFTLSCKKNSGEEPIANQDINTLVVPASFNWTTARDVNFTIATHDSRFQNAIHVIEVFIGDPANGGASMAKGSVSIISSFKFRAEIPATVNEVYLTKTAPDGSKLTQKVALTSTNIALSVGSASITQTLASANTSNLRSLSAVNLLLPTETSPDCNTGCDTEITKDGNLSMTGKTYCVTKDNITVNLNNSKSGTLRICGKNVKIDGLTVGNDINVIIASTGSATFTNMTWSGNGSFKNFGSAILGNITTRGTFYNAGPLNCGEFIVESGTATNISNITTTGNTKFKGTFTNTGTLTTKEMNMEGSTAVVTSSGTIKLASNATLTGTLYNSGLINMEGATFNINDANMKFTNDGIITAINTTMVAIGTVVNNGSMNLKYFTLNSGIFTNNCKLIVTENFINSGTSKNYSYIQVGNQSQIGNTLTMYNGAMFQTKFLQSVDGKVIGVGNTSLFQVTDLSSGSFNGTFEGTVQYCDNKRNIAVNKFIKGAIQGCDVYIPVTDCNPQGYGKAPAPQAPDRDGDKVIDTEDNYPDDPTKAFNTYSANFNAGGSTVAFEDNWPKKGDYDLNDVVITYRYLVVTNAENKVVHVKADYKLIATGGDYQNGAGIQFNIPSADAKNFSATNGATLENGQDSVVVILFKNSREQQNKWNTLPGETIAEPTAYSISFDVTNGPTFEAFGIGTYNPFIYNNGKGRSHETHLLGKNPTTLADKTLFGTEDDGSTGTGTYYKTKQGWPWALTIPTAPFNYPVESVDITKAYLKFGNWAATGGKENKDWYSSIIEGYRNNSYLFQK